MNKSIIKILSALFIMSLMSGCDDQDDFQNPQDEKVSVEFDSTQVNIHENEEMEIIQLSFDKPVSKDGVLTLAVTNTIQSRFTTEPPLSNGKISLSVREGQQSAMIKIKPANNSLDDGNLEFVLTISDTSSDFITGARDSILVLLRDDDLPPAQESVADFIGADKNVMENNAAGKTYYIKLSELLVEPGSIEISVESVNAVYGTHFNTIPIATDGKLIVSPAIGEDLASLTVIPVDNSIITGEFEITFTMTGTTGAIITGNQLKQDVSIVDDELINMPKGYEVSGGGWGLKKIYEYDESGKVKYIHTEKSTPATSTYTETYIYDTDGRIQRINTYPQIDNVFTWTDNRITKSESIDNGVLEEYIMYDYDDNGNVSGTAAYFRQPDGQFKLGFLTTYLYFLDNNLYKSLTYTPNEGTDDYTLISTRTYDGYIDEVNPFSMVEILPTVKTQTKLPSVFIVEENGLTLTYSLTYEFREDGLVLKRMASGGNQSETALYLYY